MMNIRTVGVFLTLLLLTGSCITVDAFADQAIYQGSTFQYVATTEMTFYSWLNDWLNYRAFSQSYDASGSDPLTISRIGARMRVYDASNNLIHDDSAYINDAPGTFIEWDENVGIWSVRRDMYTNHVFEGTGGNWYPSIHDWAQK